MPSPFIQSLPPILPLIKPIHRKVKQHSLLHPLRERVDSAGGIGTSIDVEARYCLYLDHAAGYSTSSSMGCGEEEEDVGWDMRKNFFVVGFSAVGMPEANMRSQLRWET